MKPTSHSSTSKICMETMTLTVRCRCHGFSPICRCFVIPRKSGEVYDASFIAPVLENVQDEAQREALAADFESSQKCLMKVFTCCVYVP